MERIGVKRYPLSKQVSDQLEHMIEQGDYAVGTRIPTEPELMQLFQVSRNTLREAIKALASAGVLEVRQGDGTYVRSNSRFNANMNREYAQLPISDVLETRVAMEASIVHLAALRRTDDDLVAIASALRSRQGLSDSASKEYTKADMEFHMAIAAACHNQVMLDLYRSIFSYLEEQIYKRQAQTTMDPHQIDLLHERLYKAIADGEPATARICVQRILSI